jgi:D-aminopeptidase
VKLPDPLIKLKMRFPDTGAADAACMMPDIERIDGRTTLYTSDDMKKAYKAFYCQTRLQRSRLI